jgi:hypothetical protein
MIEGNAMHIHQHTNDASPQRRDVGGGSIALLLLTAPILSASAAAQGSLGFPFNLPTRAFRVEGGAVALQAFVAPRRMRSGNPGAAGYPTVYQLWVRNETQARVWASIQWRFPGGDWTSEKSLRLDPQQFSVSARDTFGVIADTAIAVRVSIYSDKQLSKVLGSEETFLLFPGAEREEFIRSNSAGHPVLMTGWAEMGHPATDIAGTGADPEQGYGNRVSVARGTRARTQRFATAAQ